MMLQGKRKVSCLRRGSFFPNIQNYGAWLCWKASPLWPIEIFYLLLHSVTAHTSSETRIKTNNKIAQEPGTGLAA